MTVREQSEADAWARVWHEVDRRRVHLGIKWAEIRRRGGPTANKVRDMHKGVPLADEVTRVALCRALEWTDDSVDEILADREPKVRPQPLPETAVDVLRELRAGLAQMLEAQRSLGERVARLERTLGLSPPGG